MARLLVVRGIEEAASLLSRGRDAGAWVVLAVVVVVALVSEFALTAPVFDSAYNAYHIP